MGPAIASNLAHKAQNFVYLTYLFHKNFLRICKNMQGKALKLAPIYLIRHGT
jgi:hypothetical protein